MERQIDPICAALSGVIPESTKEIILDPWQKRLMITQGNIIISAGRRSGKTHGITDKTFEFLRSNQGVKVLVLAAAKRQAEWIFARVKSLFNEINAEFIYRATEIYKAEHDKIKLSKEEIAKIEKDYGIYTRAPTMHRLWLRNGSELWCFPAGRTGDFIRGFGFDVIIVDEASRVPRPVWAAIVPMLWISKKKRGFGWLWLLSTPLGKAGFFWECSENDDFTFFQVSSEDCPRIPREELAKWKRSWTTERYAQEVLGKFIDDWRQFFESELVENCTDFISYDFKVEFSREREYFLAVDPARMGHDLTAFVIGEMVSDTELRIVKCWQEEITKAPEIVGEIVALDPVWKFRNIYIDEGGIGGPILDFLRDEPKLDEDKIIGLDNARKSMLDDREGKIFKEDLYANAKGYMEQGYVKLIADVELSASLKSITYEYNPKTGKKTIGSKNDHLAQAFVHICWAFKDKGLDLFCDSF